jgi:hypothetical protein
MCIDRTPTTVQPAVIQRFYMRSWNRAKALRLNRGCRTSKLLWLDDVVSIAWRTGQTNSICSGRWAGCWIWLAGWYYNVDMRVYEISGKFGWSILDDCNFAGMLRIGVDMTFTHELASSWKQLMLILCWLDYRYPHGIFTIIRQELPGLPDGKLSQGYQLLKLWIFPVLAYIIWCSRYNDESALRPSQFDTGIQIEEWFWTILVARAGWHLGDRQLAYPLIPCNYFARFTHLKLISYQNGWKTHLSSIKQSKESLLRGSYSGKWEIDLVTMLLCLPFRLRFVVSRWSELN